MKTRHCPECNQDVLLSNYYKGVSKDGTQHYCKPCMAKRNKAWRDRHPGSDASRQKSYIRGKGRFVVAKAQAIHLGREWTVSKEDFEEFVTKPCDYCGESLPESGSGLDRKDSSLHYTIDNVVPCCTRCNKMKNQYLSYDEMKLIWKLRLGE